MDFIMHTSYNTMDGYKILLSPPNLSLGNKAQYPYQCLLDSLLYVGN